MKVYVHYEAADSAQQGFTAAIKIEEPTATVSDLLNAFSAKYQQKLKGSTLRATDLVLTRQDGRSIPKSRYGCLLEDEVEDGSDLSVTVVPAAQTPQPPPQASSQPSSSVKPSKEATGRARPAASTAPKPDAAASVVVKQLLEMAEGFREKGVLKKAMEVYRQVLLADRCQRGSLVGVAKIYMANQRWQEAVRYLRAAVTGRGEDDVDDADDEEDALVRGSVLCEAYLLGRAYAALGQHERAVTWLTRAARETSAGREVGGAEPITKHDVNVALAASLFELGQAETAADLLNSVIHVTSKHVGAILECARLSKRVGKLDDALTYLLQAIVIDQKHRGVRQEIVSALSSEGGMARLLQALPPSSAAAAPYAFLATIAKEGGGIASSVALYEQATALCPASASYALNLVHVHEIANDYQAAFRVGMGFLSANASRRVGSQGLKCQDVVDLLQGITDVSSSCPMASPAYTIDWVPGDDDAYAILRPSSTAEDQGPSAPTTTTKTPLSESYDSESLDLLALLFTLVKILYLRGAALPLLPSLIHLIEPTRRASKVRLHQTTIRNEHAYYCCIAQLLSVPPSRLPPTLPDGPSRRPVYVCGDSHALSPAWVPVTLMGEERILRPALVTGLKHWHLRDETEFYPKKNFYHVISSIPHGADVIFLFGEIDCREGLLVAVEKCRYASVEEGMEATIAIFIRAALKLVEKHKYRAFIHPIVPVLNETRHIVKAYNRIFERRVKETKGRLRWLDFFDGLLTDDRSALRPDLQLDGTHLHPDYLRLLPTAWEKAVAEV